MELYYVTCGQFCINDESVPVNSELMACKVQVHYSLFFMAAVEGQFLHFKYFLSLQSIQTQQLLRLH